MEFTLTQNIHLVFAKETCDGWSLVAADKNQQFLETIVLFHIECGQHRRQGD